MATESTLPEVTTENQKKTINSRVFLKIDTSTNWESNNPVLGKGEIGIQ